MARKVFLSFLGLTDYAETKYQWEDKTISKPTRFVQEAILDKIAHDWTENDRVLIFYTSKSYEYNWVDGGYKDKKGKDKKGLKTILKELSLNAHINEENGNGSFEDFIIEDGSTEEKIWDIFQTVYNQLEKEDLIYFDMTHAFRSIPIFASTLFNFSQYTLNTEVMAVHYGAFDEQGGKIVDMTNIVRLQSVIETAASISRFGRAPRSVSDNLKELVGQKDLNLINTIIKGVTDLDEFIQTNRIHDIESGSYLKKLSESKKPLKKATSIKKPVTILINDINKKINEFGFSQNNPEANIIAAINWAKKYGMLPQAYTLAREFVLIILSVKFKEFNPFFLEKEDEKDKEYREFISKLLQIEMKDVANNNLYDIFKKYPYNFFSLLNQPIISELRELDAFPLLSNYRNIINHAKKGTSKELRDNFDKSFRKCYDILKKYCNF